MNTNPSRCNPNFDPVEEFARWFSTHPQMGVPPSIANGVHRAGVFAGITLYRSGQFQAQLWLCPPGSEIPDHAHPDVDIVQFYVSGQVYLRLNGNRIIAPSDLAQTPDGLSNKNAYSIRVRPDDTHGATIGEQGGAFITAQHWIRGTPKSVELSWKGEPLDAEHAEAIGVPLPKAVNFTAVSKPQYGDPDAQ